MPQSSKSSSTKPKKLFFHTSPHTYVANIYFTDIKGNIQYTTEINSYELDYEWNEADASSMLITAFFEDWSYKVQHIDEVVEN